jgi:hopanoid C-3 methylase HpnR
MKILLVHPSPLMYAEIYLRLEPLGLERIAQSLRAAGHSVRLLDLQVFKHRDYFRELDTWRPQAVGFSLNYLANVPEVITLAMETKKRHAECFVLTGGHSASFIAKDLLAEARGAIDCVVRGEGEAIAPRLMEECKGGNIESLPGVVTPAGVGPPPELIGDLDDYPPARDLTRKRRKYFIGQMDPCASVEFTRGCPWHCSFCSAWTFYGRTYRKASPEAIVEEISRIEEPNVFVVDDVAFVHAEHSLAIARGIEKRNIRKRYYVETRCDVLIRNKEVFAHWKRLGLRYMFLGVEAIDEEGLRYFRKKVSLDKNFEALEVARELGIKAALNIIVDPDWDEGRFRVIREWARGVPEIVHLTVNTPYPGTETWQEKAGGLATRDYRLFDVQHAVLPTRLPLRQFYEELVETQSVLNRKHLGFANLKKTFMKVLGLLVRGQTNFFRMLWKFKSVYNAERQHADHFRPVEFSLRTPSRSAPREDAKDLYVHTPRSAKR